MADKVAMVHGSGGEATGELIDRIFAAEFRDQTLDEMEDSALVPGPGAYDGFTKAACMTEYDGYTMATCRTGDHMSEETKTDGGADDNMSEAANIAGKTDGHKPEESDTAGRTDGHRSEGTHSAGRLALTTDSFVVTPVKFRGGDIGRLAVCGTVNDLLMRGAKPMYLTCGWILEEGTDIDLVREMAHSMALTAREAGIRIVAGDTKVIDGSIGDKSAGDAAGKFCGGILINTAGVGFVSEGVDISAKNLQPGDAILVSGSMGDHHAAILSERMSISTDIKSDNAPLTEIVSSLVGSGLHIHTLRDITRGGLATVLKELAETSRRTCVIEQEKVPVTPTVQDFCSLLGLDPLYMGNEGKLVCILPEDEAEQALELIRRCRYGAGAARIGRVSDDGEPGSLIMRTEIGGERLLDVLQGEGLPRIC